MPVFFKLICEKKASIEIKSLAVKLNNLMAHGNNLENKEKYDVRKWKKILTELNHLKKNILHCRDSASKELERMQIVIEHLQGKVNILFLKDFKKGRIHLEKAKEEGFLTWAHFLLNGTLMSSDPAAEAAEILQKYTPKFRYGKCVHENSASNCVTCCEGKAYLASIYIYGLQKAPRSIEPEKMLQSYNTTSKGICFYATCLRDGIGFVRDQGEAFELLLQEWRKLQQQDHVMGRVSYLLAICYRDGLGVAPDEKKADSLFQEAEEDGYNPCHHPPFCDDPVIAKEHLIKLKKPEPVIIVRPAKKKIRSNPCTQLMNGTAYCLSALFQLATSYCKTKKVMTSELILEIENEVEKKKLPIKRKKIYIPLNKKKTETTPKHSLFTTFVPTHGPVPAFMFTPEAKEELKMESVWEDDTSSESSNESTSSGSVIELETPVKTPTSESKRIESKTLEPEDPLYKFIPKQMVDRIMKTLGPFFIKLSAAGHECGLTGGALRDILMNPWSLPSDWDVAGSATHENLMNLFGDCGKGLKGSSINLYVVEIPAGEVEITQFHRYDPQARMVESKHDDPITRDFTMNSLFLRFNPLTQKLELLDPTGQGLADLKKKCVRTTENPPENSFKRDPVRMVRAVYLAEKIGGEIEEHTKKAILHLQSELDMLRQLRAGKRFLQSFELLLKIMALPKLKRDKAVTALKELNLFDELCAQIQLGFSNKMYYPQFTVIPNSIATTINLIVAGKPPKLADVFKQDYLAAAFLLAAKADTSGIRAANNLEANLLGANGVKRIKNIKNALINLARVSCYYSPKPRLLLSS